MTAIITTEDKLKEARRELQMRINVYPRWIDSGKISAGTAELRIEIMKQIVADYETMLAQLKLPL